MMIGEAQSWMSLASTALALGALLYSWLTARSSSNSKHLETMTAEVQRLEKRVQNLESDVRHIPTKDSVHQLEIAIAEIKGDIHAMSETFAAVQRTASRIENYLLDKSK